MAATWQELMKHFNGTMTVGRVVVRINKKNVEIGRMRNGVFAWTIDGMELSQTVSIPRALPVTSQPSRRRAARKPEVTPDAGSED